MTNLDELPEGEILRSMALYQLLRPGTRVDSEGDIAPFTGQIEIRVFKYLNGERIGQFMAQPYLGMTYKRSRFYWPRRHRAGSPVCHAGQYQRCSV